MPPLTTTIAAPLFPPEQLTWVKAVVLTEIVATGCMMVAERVVLHPRASVTVQIQVPAPRLVAVALFCAGVVFQMYVYGLVPPVTAMVAFPVVPPKQFTSVWPMSCADNDAAGCVMVTFWLVEQPRASVTVQVHVPAAKPLAAAEFCGGTVFQL